MTASQPTRTYLVVMPLAEARHLAGTGPGRPTTPEHHLAAAIREWLAGLSRRRATIIAVRKVITDLSLLLETSPLPRRPLRGPFGPARHGPPLAGWVEYLGGGIVRLDEAAISALATLPGGEDFKVTHTDAGPVLAVGADTYLAREEQPSPRADRQPPPGRVAARRPTSPPAATMPPRNHHTPGPSCTEFTCLCR